MVPTSGNLFSTTLAVSISLLSFTNAAALSNKHPRGQIQTVQWGACEGINSTVPIECGILAVPLDYTNSTSFATTNLALLRIPASDGPSKGSILMNFGGPGGEGRFSLALGAPLFTA